jgi:hypothetical protein
MTHRSSNLISGCRCVRIAERLPCPGCGREIKPHDVTIGNRAIRIVCTGCHSVVIEIERTDYAS